MKCDSNNPFEGPIIPLGPTGVEYYPISAQFGKKVLPGISFAYALIAGRNLERRYSGCSHRGIVKDRRIGNPSSMNHAKKS